MLLAFSKTCSPPSRLLRGACQPPCVKPPLGSSAGPPGACATPSSVMNSVTMSLPMVYFAFPGGCSNRSDVDRVQESSLALAASGDGNHGCGLVEGVIPLDVVAGAGTVVVGAVELVVAVVLDPWLGGVQIQP